MSKKIKIKVHEIATDGMPRMDEMTGRVAFIFDGCMVSGWPIEGGDPLWEANSDVGSGQKFLGVTHWIEFPVPVWKLTR
ncbi:hypothetical protein [Cryobacterium sp. GrIS_2_6]|uniref:hypothetical protein n=1 Tax=Cryobacterium sp. GrIS_2_6 TaxID=3162785 RepID=UPI002E093C2F|nr:hypothetical protein [Cryobacterium psychrotolerans]MEC5149254.1 hypothetical protein [Cryobacterium psychrotolerans]MEC5149332.1 hypothetical protein [Cryobacterium psychrotolerans]